MNRANVAGTIRRWILALALIVAIAPPMLIGGLAGAQPNGVPLRFSLVEPPRPVPELVFKDAEGRSLRLADFRGRVVLLNIWATWCVSCRKEMPTLDRLQATLGGPDFEVVALSIDRGGSEVVRRFYDEIGVKGLKIYLDESGASFDALGAVGLPTSLLVDREGREIGRLVGPAVWDSDEAIALIRRHIG